MPIDKRARLRYLIIDSCFTNRQKRNWTADEFLEKFRKHDVIITRRTLERDFEAMRYDSQLGYNAPIAYDRSDKSFYYTDSSFTIKKLPITPDDLQPFRVATNILQQYKGLDFVKQFEGVIDKLGKIVEQIDQPETSNIIALEDSPYYKGHTCFDVMAKAIMNKQPLDVTYEKFDRTRHEHIFHPYFLREHDDRWYVVGYSETRHYTLTLGLDRFERIDNASSPYRENKKINQQNYFKHTLGVTVGKGPVQNIKLWFSPQRAPYILTKHLHGTQNTICENETGLVISLQLIPNFELIQLILSFGADVKVLSPDSLQQQVKESIAKMMACYNDSDLIAIPGALTDL